MKWGLWSTTASSNSATPPDGWPEGQAPSTVNDCAREMMAQIRSAITDLQFVDQGDSPTFVSSTRFSVPGNITATYQIGRRLKLFDSSTLYGTIIDASGSAASTTVTMRMDGGVISSSLSSIAVAVLSPQNDSLPMTVARVENVLINPYLDIWNGGIVFSASANVNMVTADMFRLLTSMSTTLALNVTRFERSANASNVPTLAQCGVLLNNSIGISVSTGVATVGSTQFSTIDTRLEGYNFRQLAQKPMAFQFWVKTNRTGTYCMSVKNTGGTQTYLQEFSASSTSWERKTFFIPPTPATGTWDYSSGVGLILSVVLACGSGFTTIAGNWTATNAIATSNQINFFSSAGNVIRLTGFGLQEGTQCGPLQYKNYLEEDLKCRRYRPFFGINTSGNVPLASGQVVNVGQALISVPFMVPSRIQVTGINMNGNTTNTFVVSNPTNALAQASAISVNLAGFTNAQLLVSVVGAVGLGAAGDATYFSNTGTSASFVLTGAEL